MKNKINLIWQVGHQETFESTCENYVPATVPGAVQLDWAKAKQFPDYWYGDNYKLFTWMEDKYWIYRTTINIKLEELQKALLSFKGIDYQYIIRIDGIELYHNEGMFSQINIDITPYCNKDSILEVVIFPIPKAVKENSRNQARESVKPAVSYGWDWHPRLVPMGIWDEAYIEIIPESYIQNFDISYILNDDYSIATVTCNIEVNENCQSKIILQNAEGTIVISNIYTFAKGNNEIKMNIENPDLWWVTEWGKQSVYTIISEINENNSTLQKIEKKIGFRSVKLLMNEGAWNTTNLFPKTQSIAPITLELNGKKIFAKGTNWVNPEIFPGIINEKTYSELLKLIKEANMNIVRLWGGGIINKDCFYDLCDEMGIMVWQEFPLSCNLYPDNDKYLAVLNTESINIIKKLRIHPSLVIWCGGNELFNGWSGMTEQAFALRLLNNNCYQYDRQTPFLMTAPVYGMGHGHYNNVDNGDTEFIGTLIKSEFSAYTEFGSPGSSPKEYIQTFMTKEEYNKCGPETVWETHHAFGAWNTKDTWLRTSEADYYFGGYDDIDDLVEKCSMIQTINYKSFFEEIRKKWPKCSMAINWCFNEPWPTAANNSIVNWPAIPKKAYYGVKDALRSQMLSIRAIKNLWEKDESFSAEIWLLNDSPRELSAQNIKVYIEFEGCKEHVITWISPIVESQKNLKGPKINKIIPHEAQGIFKVFLESDDNASLNSCYTYIVKNKLAEKNQEGLLNM